MRETDAPNRVRLTSTSGTRRPPSGMSVAAATKSPERSSPTQPMAATRVPSLSFFAKGRAVAKPCQPLTANHTTNTPIMPAQPKNKQKQEPAPRKQNNLPVRQQQPEPPVPSGVPSDSPRSPLNPLAPEFVPFSVFLPLYDSDDELADDAESPQHADRVDHLFEDTLLWSKFDESDLGGEPPAPCDCHQVSRGSCPDFKAYHVDRIQGFL